MDTLNYRIIQVGFFVLTVVCMGLVLWGLSKVLKQSDLPAASQRKVFRLTILGITGWAVVSGLMAWSGFLSNFDTIPPRFPLLILPPLIAVLVLTFSRGFTHLLQFVPPSWFLYIQAFRIPVEILLWALFITELLPVQMTFEGINFDILAGIAGPIFAWFCFSRKKWSQRTAQVYNVAGLLLLLNIVTIAILSFPTPFRVFMNEPANTIVTYFPIVWLPALLVTLAYSMHFFSLRQLAKYDMNQG